MGQFENPEKDGIAAVGRSRPERGELREPRGGPRSTNIQQKIHQRIG